MPAGVTTAVVSFMTRSSVFSAALLAAALLAPVAAAEAQRDRQGTDSTSARCMNVTWLDPKAVCEGRVTNTVVSGVLAGLVGAGAGFVGGSIINTACIGNGETAAVRGAIAGAAIGAIGTLFTPHVSRRALAARHARNAERARTRGDTVRAWSWRDIRPAVQWIGYTGLGGAAVGAWQGGREDAACGGVGGGAARGAGVYAAGTTTTIVGSLLVVRFFF
jgi:hypothetical protein